MIIRGLSISNSETMKRFMKLLICFVVSIVGMATLTEAFVRHIPNSYKYKKEWIITNGDRVKNLILGNSTIDNAFNPAYVDSTFSFANSDQLLEYDEFILKKYSKYCPNLKNVIVALDYGNLFDSEYETKAGFGWYRAIYYQVYLGYEKHPVLSRYSYETSNPLSVRNKLVGYLSSVITGHNIEYLCDSLGRTTQESFETKRDITEDMIESYANKPFCQEDYERNVNYVRGMASFCQENGLRLILVSCPKWHDVVPVLKKERTERIFSLADEIVSQYPCCEYKSYLSDSLLTCSRSYFRDVTHMSNEGSRLFTRIFVEDFGL